MMTFSILLLGCLVALLASASQSENDKQIQSQNVKGPYLLQAPIVYYYHAPQAAHIQQRTPQKGKQNLGNIVLSEVFPLKSSSKKAITSFVKQNKNSKSVFENNVTMWILTNYNNSSSLICRRRFAIRTSRTTTTRPIRR